MTNAEIIAVLKSRLKELNRSQLELDRASGCRQGASFYAFRAGLGVHSHTFWAILYALDLVFCIEGVEMPTPENVVYFIDEYQEVTGYKLTGRTHSNCAFTKSKQRGLVPVPKTLVQILDLLNVSWDIRTRFGEKNDPR